MIKFRKFEKMVSEYCPCLRQMPHASPYFTLYEGALISSDVDADVKYDQVHDKIIFPLKLKLDSKGNVVSTNPDWETGKHISATDEKQVIDELIYINKRVKELKQKYKKKQIEKDFKEQL